MFKLKSNENIKIWLTEIVVLNGECCLFFMVK